MDLTKKKFYCMCGWTGNLPRHKIKRRKINVNDESKIIWGECPNCSRNIEAGLPKKTLAAIKFSAEEIKLKEKDTYFVNYGENDPRSARLFHKNQHIYMYEVDSFSEMAPQPANATIFSVLSQDRRGVLRRVDTSIRVLKNKINTGTGDWHQVNEQKLMGLKNSDGFYRDGLICFRVKEDAKKWLEMNRFYVDDKPVVVEVAYSDHIMTGRIDGILCDVVDRYKIVNLK